MIIAENSNLSWIDKLVHVSIIIICLYPAKLVAVYLGVPGLILKMVYNQGKWPLVLFKLLLSVFLGVVLYRLALYLYIYPFIYERSTDNGQFFTIGRFLSNFADLTVPMLLFGAMWMYDARLKADQEKSALELQFLKNQSSPHFLLNALNGIFGLARKNDVNTAPAMLKLSGILRYLLYDSSSTRISLQKELDVIHQYIDIQKLRFGSTLTLTMNQIDVSPDIMISPGLLLPLLENAFKFGFSDVLNVIYVNIKFEISDDQKFFVVIKNHVSDSVSYEPGGLGLKNLNRRLQLEYPGKHKFESGVENGQYFVHLQLLLK